MTNYDYLVERIASVEKKFDNLCYEYWQKSNDSIKSLRQEVVTEVKELRGQISGGVTPEQLKKLKNQCFALITIGFLLTIAITQLLK